MAEGVLPASREQEPEARLLLSIDTCGPSGSVALGRLAGGTVEILGQKELAGRSYSATLVAAVGELLAGAGVRLNQLAGIVAVHGPGSFTGVRVGLSAVKGLAEVKRTPVVAVSRLEVLAWKAGVGAAALDAHRHEVFLRLGGNGIDAHEMLAGAEELASLSPAPERVAVCDAAEDLLAAAWPGAERVRTPAPSAADALQLCAGRVAQGEFVDLALLDGNYLRRSDAEIFGQPGEEASHPGRKSKNEARKEHSDQVRIRPMRVADLARVMEIEHELRDAPKWSQRAWQAAIDPQAARKRIAVVAEEPEREIVQGFAVASLAALEAELESIGVSPEWQRRGLARRMFLQLKNGLQRAGVRELFLEVRASNRAALELYEALGFAETGRRDRYYDDPEEDAVLMQLQMGRTER